MKDTLKSLLDHLQTIGENHEELFDTDVRQNMSNAIVDGFVRHRHDYIVPDDFGMFSKEANRAVKAAIAQYIAAAIQKADEMELTGFHERLNAVQDSSVRSFGGNDYDEFLGHSPAEFFDQDGIVIRTH
jgi:hypothetical protein